MALRKLVISLSPFTHLQNANSDSSLPRGDTGEGKIMRTKPTQDSHEAYLHPR